MRSAAGGIYSLFYAKVILTRYPGGAASRHSQAAGGAVARARRRAHRRDAHDVAALPGGRPGTGQPHSGDRDRLVNNSACGRASKAELLAQAHLDGGGNTDADRRAKTPLPVLPRESANATPALASRKVERLEKRTQEMLTQIRSAAAVAPPLPEPDAAPETTELPSASEMMQHTLEAMRLEAKIAKDLDAYQKRPKRRFVGARAAEYRFARYVEDWRLKVERVGNNNYPEAARSEKLYGSLLLTVGIRADDSVETVVVDRPSGKKILDLAAIKIVEMGGPYSPFPPDIKRDTDILYITRTWTFVPGNSLTSQ
ncbi:MAG: TonB family protein [Betaproteobacteria bacterium]|nr:MAG: TonB family protein [Betaproteobacteria bacterium]